MNRHKRYPPEVRERASKFEISSMLYRNIFSQRAQSRVSTVQVDELLVRQAIDGWTSPPMARHDSVLDDFSKTSRADAFLIRIS